MSSYETKIDVAKRLWKIAAISAEHGNELMDLIGYESYVNVMNLVKKDRESKESPREI